MKQIIHHAPDGHVERTSLNPKLVSLLMGSGDGKDEATIERQSLGRAINGASTIPLPLATEWVLATATGGLTEAEIFDLHRRVLDAQNGYLESVIIEETDLPYDLTGNGDPNHGSCLDPTCHDRYFRDALIWDDTAPNKCRCDMSLSRGIHMGQIRRVRDQELAKLDVPFMKALEAGDAAEQQRIAALKRELRDIPQTFDLSRFRTPATLKAAWPTRLQPRNEVP